MTGGVETRKKLKQTHRNNRNSMVNNGPSKSQLSSNTQSAIQAEPKIFMLKNDCFNEIFEYLSLKEIYAIGETCKTLQSIAGEYFTRNYSAAPNVLTADGFNAFYIDEKSPSSKRILLPKFNRFVKSISFTYNRVESIQYIQSHSDEFESINEICMTNYGINRRIIKQMRKILPKIETLQFRSCSFDRNSFEFLLQYCVSLKKISVSNVYFHDNAWLSHEYPTLEHLELLYYDMSPVVNELQQFFAKNLNVKRFTTTSAVIWFNKDVLLTSKVHLDLLEIYTLRCFERFWQLVDRLHQQDLYKRLHIYTEFLKKNDIIEMTSIQGLEGFSCEYLCRERNDISLLTNLTELSIPNISEFNHWNDIHIVADSLIKLERLYLSGNVSVNDILPFIRKSSRLIKIKLIPCIMSDPLLEPIEFDEKDSAHSNREDLLEIATLNKEREKLAGARKVTIYIPDYIFLRTKLTARNGITNFSLIEIKRIDSHQWNPPRCYD